MSEYKVKLASKLPKGELNGFDYTIISELAEAGLAMRSTSPRVAILVYGLNKSEGDPANGTATAVLGVLRVEPVLTNAGRRAVEELLVSEFSHRTGAAILPFEAVALSKAAFADLPRTVEEIDEREAREQDLMSPTDELRRHLAVVHGVGDAHLLTAEGADEKHRADHDGDVLGPLAHEANWIGWTRADLEAAEFEAEESGGAGETDPTTAKVDAPFINPWDDSEPAGIEGTDIVRAEHSMQADMDAEAAPGGEVVPLFRNAEPTGTPEVEQTTSKPVEMGPWFDATYDGTCSDGECEFEAGDRIRADGNGGYLCRECGGAE